VKNPAWLAEGFYHGSCNCISKATDLASKNLPKPAAADQCKMDLLITHILAWTLASKTMIAKVQGGV